MKTHLFARLAFAVALMLVAAACSDDKINGPAAGPRVFNQVERLGNPLVSEVFLDKRDHGFHNAGKPSTDVANFKTKLEGFVRNVAGRNQTVQTTLSSVLLPDMLIVQLDKTPSSAGWLTWALANGYGGRRLNDDVVDAGLAALFGSLIDPNNQSPGLASQHVPGNDKPFLSTFPYLAEASR